MTASRVVRSSSSEPRLPLLEERGHSLGDVVGGCDLLDEQRFERERRRHARRRRRGSGAAWRPHTPASARSRDGRPTRRGSASNRSADTTSFTSPSRCASLIVSASAKNTSCLAMFGGIARSRRYAAPPSGMRPRRVKSSMIVACSTATTRSAANTRFAPAASGRAVEAAEDRLLAVEHRLGSFDGYRSATGERRRRLVDLDRVRTRDRAGRGRCRSGDRRPRCSTTTRTSGSPLASTKASMSWRCIALSNELPASGRLRTRRSTPASNSRSSSVSWSLTIPSWLLREPEPATDHVALDVARAPADAVQHGQEQAPR